MRTQCLCISVLRVASGPRVKLASCKSALIPSPPPTPEVDSTDRSKAVVLVLFLLFVASFPHCFLFFFFFKICCDASIVMTAFNSCPLCFLFYYLRCDASIFYSRSAAAHFVFCFTNRIFMYFCIKSSIGAQGEVS